MTWPDAGRFEKHTHLSECPECGADDTQLGERTISTRVVPIVEDELKLLVEAVCPCGYEDSFEITADAAE